MVIRLTPNGRVVRFFVSAISVSSRSGVIAPQAITPNAPALESAETRLRSEIQLIAPPRMATSQPRKSVPRCIRRRRRSWPIPPSPLMGEGSRVGVASFIGDAFSGESTPTQPSPIEGEGFEGRGRAQAASSASSPNAVCSTRTASSI